MDRFCYSEVHIHFLLDIYLFGHYNEVYNYIPFSGQEWVILAAYVYLKKCFKMSTYPEKVKKYLCQIHYYK